MKQSQKMGKKAKKKDRFTTVLLFIVLIAGLSLLLYPSFADYWNSFHATKVISEYSDTVAEMSDDELSKMWDDAVKYNEDLYSHGGLTELSDSMRARYESLLNIGGSGVMGYIDIDCIKVSLPVYHGTSDGVLQVAAGHVDWSSLPTGGLNTHCVMSGHRGLPSAKLFTDIDSLKEGDIFVLTILNQTLTYEVDQIRIVEPENVQDLDIVSGMDYCTLVTCTPYGINTHRLLVRGHRIENIDAGAGVYSEAVVIEPLLVAPIVAIPLLIALLLLLLNNTKKSGRKLDKDKLMSEIKEGIINEKK